MLTKIKHVALGLFLALAFVFAVSVATGVGPASVTSIEAAKSLDKDSKSHGDKADKGGKGGGGLRWIGID